MTVLYPVTRSIFRPILRTQFVRDAIPTIIQRVEVKVNGRSTIHSQIIVRPQLQFTVVILVQRLHQFLINNHRITLTIPSITQPICTPRQIISKPCNVPVQPVVDAQIRKNKQRPFRIKRSVTFTRRLLPINYLVYPRRHHIVFHLRPVPRLIEYSKYSLLRPFLR